MLKSPLNYETLFLYFSNNNRLKKYLEQHRIEFIGNFVVLKNNLEKVNLSS
jgi:hypothetical protein